MRRSARRQMVLATWRVAPAGDPPARMNRRSGGTSWLELIDEAFEPRHGLVAECGLGHPGRDPIGWIGKLGAEREQIPLNRRQGPIEVGV